MGYYFGTGVNGTIGSIGVAGGKGISTFGIDKTGLIIFSYSMVGLTGSTIFGS